MHLRSPAAILIFIGIAFIVLGGLTWLATRCGFPLGRLPGDINLSGKNWSVYFPVVTCIVLSILLTLVMRLLYRK
jgi:hypothetical protein